MSAPRVRFLVALALAVALLASCGQAHAEKWTRAVIADDVSIVVHVLTIQELKRKGGAGLVADMRDAHASHHGYSVLVRTAAGELRCDVYVTADATEETLEHEARHCHGWVHR